MSETPTSSKQNSVDIQPDNANDNIDNADTDTLIKKLNERYQHSGAKGIENDLHDIAANERKLLADRLVTKLKAQPKSWDDHSQWHSCAAVLSIVDPQVHSSCSAEILAMVKSTLLFIEKDVQTDDETLKRLPSISRVPTHTNNQSDPLIQLDARLKKLAQCIGLQTLPMGYKLCIDKFGEWENQVKKDYAQNIPGFLNSQIAIGKSSEKDFWQEIMEKGIHEAITFKAEQGNTKEFWSLFKKEEKGYYYTSKDTDGKSLRWKVEGHEAIIYFRCANEDLEGLFFAIDPMESLEELEKNPNKLNVLAENAVSNFMKENGKEQRRELKEYDFPSDRNIAHIRLFPKIHDQSGVISKGLQTSVLLSATLEKHYAHRFSSRQPLFSDNPEKALRDEIQRALVENKKTPLHFCVDIFSHGAKDRFLFAKPLEASQVIAIAKDFPQCSFTYNTIACYGGGMMQGMADNNEFSKNKELSSRLAVFTQSKGNVINLSTVHATAVTMYYMHFMQALNEGKTYGEAHRIADSETKKYMPVDAEAMIDGKKLVMNKPIQITNVLSV